MEYKSCREDHVREALARRRAPTEGGRNQEETHQATKVNWRITRARTIFSSASVSLCNFCGARLDRPVGTFPAAPTPLERPSPMLHLRRPAINA